VLANCLYVLKQSSAHSTSMTLPRSIAINLLNNIRRFSDWAMCLVLEVLLAHYRPASESERFEVLDILDFGLNHTNSAVIMATAKIFLHYTAAYPDQLERVLDSIRGPLQTLVLGREPEIAYAALANIVVLAHRHPTLWSTFGQLAADLFCRPEDPSYLKLLKMDALVAVANPSNAYDIIEEVEQYAKDGDEAVVRAAVRSVARIALKVPGVEGALDRVILLLERPPGSIVAEEAIIAVADVLRRHSATAEPVEAFIPAVSEIDVTSLKTARATVAYVWILGEYGHMIQDAPYVLEGMIMENLEKEKFTSSVRLALLTAITKLFFKRPPECRKALGYALQQGVQDEDAMVRDRAATYYALLADGDPQIAKSIVRAPCTAIAIESQPPEVRDRIFDEWNSLSVIYNAPATSFISSSTFEAPATDSISELIGEGESEVQVEEEEEEQKSMALLLDMDLGTANASPYTSGIGELEETFQGLAGLEGQSLKVQGQLEHPQEEGKVSAGLGTGDLLGL
jgi:vesicle coat complex subunit